MINPNYDNISREDDYSPYYLYAADLKWQDSTSYSRGEKWKTSPRSFKYTNNDFSISIISEHIRYKGIWIMNCNALGISELVCKNCDSATQAAEFAVKVSRQKVKKLASYLNM